MREKSRDYIHPSGGLLSIQFIQKLKQENIKEKYVESQTFSMPREEPLPPGELDKKMTNAWKSLLEKWFSISPFIRKYDISEARKKWIIPLLEALDFNPQYLKKDTLISEEKMTKIPLSHRGGDWPYAPIIHTVAPSQDLDEKITKGRGEKSPHDALQIYLNESREDQWGIVTNGTVLRILRDYYHTYTKGYVEFDLESIFEERSFSDFRALCRLVHPSRFIPDEEGISPLEHFYKISLAAGEKIGNELRVNVLNAIEALGNGFLTKELRETLIEDPEECKAYYQEILHVIYRIIFLLFAEQRGMLPTRDSLYAEAYSLTRLGEKVEKTKRRDRHYDLWKGLLVTFDIVRRGVDDPDSKLTAFGYNGSLFDESKIKRLINLKCENTGILSAIRNLTYFESEHTLQRISYVDLGVEEIGSIYESLLDYTPRITNEDILFDGKTYTEGTFYLDSRGTARKSTGSYYTHLGLINELIQSALKPVLEDRLTGKESTEEKESALLSIKVCDPACGSGAFLIAAANFLGKELAKIRTDTEYPPDKEERKARRDVLQHCIYGVDLNPMAVELAKVSLWINACVEDMPLNFLDHHIKCGNSLVGTTPELLEKGIPNEAFKPVKGDDIEFAKKIEEINKNQTEVRTLEEFEKEVEERKFAMEYEKLSDIEERKPEDVEKKKEKYDCIIESPEWYHRKVVADAWTAAFFWPLKLDSPPPPTEAVLRMLKRDKKAEKVDKKTLEKIEELVKEYKFFHWHLEFPDVFSGSDPGFDCVLGNPPWDKLKVMEREWFKGKNEKIAKCESKTRRNSLIQSLIREDPVMYTNFRKALRNSELQTRFIFNSGRFPLSAKGDVNTYPLFTELSGISLINGKGRVGMVVKTAIATDYGTKNLFSYFIEENHLISLYDFVNTEKIFPHIASSERFCLLTLSGKDNLSKKFDFSFYNTNFDMLKDEKGIYSLRKADIIKVSPNTKNCPMFKTRNDRDITLGIYDRYPILINDEIGENPWRIKYATLFHMSNDSILFSENTKENLESRGFILKEDGIFRKGEDIYLPMYEAKNINIYDHRFGTFEGIPPEKRFITKAQPKSPKIEQKQDPEYEIETRYWMKKIDFETHRRSDWNSDWIFSFRNFVTPTTNTRSTMGTIVPFFPIGNSAPVLTFQGQNPAYRCLLFCAIFLSFPFDYILRQNLGGYNLNLFILEQLPIPTPEQVQSYNVHYENQHKQLDVFLVERAVKLVVTSYSLKCILDELGIEEEPYIWNEEERRQFIWEIDAAVAHLFGLTKEMYAHIFSEFRIQKDKDISTFGAFITKERCLELFDKMSLEVKK